ncbi:hypothetical protein [Streptomyces hygroscopicus]|uniref:hypothetical protein n=1 Tax=Streptomyces hygroscopicus TaxID=1912 RepID=UPI00369574F3
MEWIPPGEQAADTAGFAEDDHGEDLHVGAVSSTGLRPRWSEVLPSRSSAAGTATVYVPKTMVVVSEEKSHASA